MSSGEVHTEGSIYKGILSWDDHVNQVVAVKRLDVSGLQVTLLWLCLLKIYIDVVSALDYLHNRIAETHRLIHHYIKSANILLAENWNGKLVDFGLSRIGLANQQNRFLKEAMKIEVSLNTIFINFINIDMFLR
uniref:Protein kinase domain-containing protein n=1 Tax=Lactuca sativa TaxID=4236 RepID=A0A9R1WS76_LACSA|nr:hypothetical protein LSAT_V11C100036060 [Lactuca sativa]